MPERCVFYFAFFGVYTVVVSMVGYSLSDLGQLHPGIAQTLGFHATFEGHACYTVTDSNRSGQIGISRICPRKN